MYTCMTHISDVNFRRTSRNNCLGKSHFEVDLMILFLPLEICIFELEALWCNIMKIFIGF